MGIITPKKQDLWHFSKSRNRSSDEAAGILQKSVSRYETGIALPTLETLEKIAKVLKKPFAYFLD